MALRRLNKDLRSIKKDNVPGISAAPILTKRIGPNGDNIVVNNMFHWKAVITGPSDTPYEGGKFHLDITFPAEYPFKPPSIKFDTKIYHPNISYTGAICVTILKTGWSPALDIIQVLLSISSLLSDPNPDDPLNNDVTDVYRSSPELFIKTAQDWTKKYASS